MLVATHSRSANAWNPIERFAAAGVEASVWNGNMSSRTSGY
jgi:hypothetical protein